MMNRSANDATLVANTARPGLAGGGSYRDNAPGVLWSGKPNPSSGVYDAARDTSRNKRPGNPQKHWGKRTVATITVSTGGFIGGVILVIEAVRK